MSDPRRVAVAALILLLWAAPAWAQPACDSTTGTGTALARAAANLTANDGTASHTGWCEFTATGTTSALSSADAGGIMTNGNITGYARGGAWDPKTGTWDFIGMDHDTVNRAEKWIRYSESTNSWAKITSPSISFLPAGFWHNFALMTEADQILGEWYIRQSYDGNNGCAPGCQQFYRYNIDAGTFTALPIMPGDPGGSESGFGGPSVWFPDMGAMIDWGAVFGKVFAYHRSSNTWQTLATGVTGPGDYYGAAIYNPIHKVVWLVGSNSTLNWKLSHTGTVTALAAAPTNLGGVNYIGQITVDPATGDFLMFPPDGSFRSFDIQTGTYTTLTAACASVPANNGCPNTFGAPAPVYGTIMTSLTNYGVIMTAQCRGGNPCNSSKMYLYKHTPRTAAADWTRRKTATGVIRSYDFDDTSQFTTCGGGTNGCFGSNFGEIPIFGTSDYSHIIRDTTTAAPGTPTSSLKYNIPQGTGSGLGEWFTNFSADLSQQFGQTGLGDGAVGNEFYIQWRQRFDPNLLNTIFTSTAGGNAGGWKQVIITAGDRAGTNESSCVDIDVPVQNTNQAGFPQMYHSCGVKDSQYQPLDEPTTSFAGSDLYKENGVRAVAAASSSRACLYTQGRVPPGCSNYVANTWMTFQVRIKVGTWYKNDGVYHHDSVVQMWVAQEGQPSRLVMDFSRHLNTTCDGTQSALPACQTAYDLVRTNANPLQKFGKIFLTAYHTNKDPAQTHATAATWFDELVISTSRVPDPAGSSIAGGSPPTVPNAPSSLTVTNP